MTPISAHRQGAALVVVVGAKNLDARIGRELVQRLATAAQEDILVVVDLSAVEFVDTGALGGLCDAYRTAKPGHLRLAAVSRRLSPGLSRVPPAWLPPRHETVPEALSLMERRDPSGWRETEVCPDTHSYPELEAAV